MKKVKIIASISLAIVTVFTSCNPDVEIPKQDTEGEYTMIYMPQAEGGAKTFNLDVKQAADEIIFGAAYGGIGWVDRDVIVSIAVDPTLVDEYNTEKGTAYVAVPAEAYSVTDNEVVIPRGKFSSTVVKALIQTSMLSPLNEYILAAKITSTDADLPINEKLQEAFFILHVNYPIFNRAQWLVESLSSEEPKEATWGNGGQVIHTFDDKNNTFWHSRWDGGEAPPPHWFVIDMGETRSMHGFSFLGRQSGNDGKPKEVLIQLSIDGISWSDGETINLLNENSLQKVFLSNEFNTQARYFKITITTSYSANFTHLAEIYAF